MGGGHTNIRHLKVGGGGGGGGCTLNTQQKEWATRKSIKFYVNSSDPPTVINNDRSLILPMTTFLGYPNPS